MNTVFATSNSSLLKPLSGGLQFLAIAAFLGASSLPVNAQGYGAPGTETIRDPLVTGARWTPAGVAAPQGLPPPIGSGAVPAPINPGQLNGPTFEPWIQRIPANQIDQQNSFVPLPFAQPTALPPNTAGPMGNPPPPPSTPGDDPGMLRAPSAAANVTPGAGGIYPDGAAPTTHRPGQTTGDFGGPRKSVRGKQSSTLTDFGQRLAKKDLATAPEYSEDGPQPVQPYSDPPGQAPQVTHDLYGAPMLSNTNDGETPKQIIAPY